jgi:hypothetical protein
MVYTEPAVRRDMQQDFAAFVRDALAARAVAGKGYR